MSTNRVASTRRSSMNGPESDDDVDMSNSSDDLGSELNDPNADSVSSDILDIIQELATRLCSVKEEYVNLTPISNVEQSLNAVLATKN